eukprot:15388116-Alexandrium_andersonii.AAC.1
MADAAGLPETVVAGPSHRGGASCPGATPSTPAATATHAVPWLHASVVGRQALHQATPSRASVSG